MQKQLRRWLGTFCKYSHYSITSTCSSWRKYVDICGHDNRYIQSSDLLYSSISLYDIMWYNNDTMWRRNTPKKTHGTGRIARSWALPGQTWEEPRCSSKHEALLALTCVFCAYIWLDYEPYTHFAEMLPSKIGCCYQAFRFSCCDWRYFQAIGAVRRS